MTFDIIQNPDIVVKPLKPIWFITTQLSLPLGDKDIDAIQLALTMALVFRIQIKLFDVFNKPSRRGRSIQQDQLELFLQIEDNIAAMGVDGHACVLRFICELQTNRFAKSSMFGELFTLMFTPKQGDDYTILKDYIEAEMVGQDSPGTSCIEKYYTCPVSVFAALKSFQGGLGFSTPSDKPLNTTIYSPYKDPLLPMEDNVV